MHHIHPSRNGVGVTPRLHARERTRRGLLGGLFRQAWRHPLATGAVIATIGWLFSGGNQPSNPARARRGAGHVRQTTGAGSVINGEASHG